MEQVQRHKSEKNKQQKYSLTEHSEDSILVMSDKKSFRSYYYKDILNNIQIIMHNRTWNVHLKGFNFNITVK